MNDDFDLKAEEEGEERQTSSKRLIVALVLLGIVALSFKVHWIAGYVLLVTILLFLVFYLPSPKWRRLLLTFYLFFVITLLTSTGLQMFLAGNKTVGRLVAENKVVNFLIGGLTEQIILSTVIGLITGASVVGLPLLVVMLVSSEYILALHQIHGIRRGDALRVLWSLIMGINYPWMIIDGGKVIKSKPEGILPAIGGPGVAVIRPGNAVVFERSGKISRIVGPGLVLLKQYERIKAIFELRPLGETRETENVLTKDRIPLTIVMGVGFQIEPKEVTDQRPESFVEPNGEALSEVIGTLYKTYRATLEKAVYHAPPDGWEVMIPGGAQSLLRDIIGTYNFDDIFRQVGEMEGEEGPGGFDPNQRTIKEIEDKIMERLSAEAPKQGVHARGVDIREIRIREDVLGKMLDWWGAEWKRRIAIKEAEGERAVMLTLAEAERVRLIEGAKAEATKTTEAAQAERDAAILKADGERIALLRTAEAEARALTVLEEVKAEARGEVIRQMMDALNQVPRDMALRFISVVEQLSRDMVTDNISARRYVEVLEAIAKSGGQKTIIIGGERQLLWPRRRTSGAIEAPEDRTPDEEG
jgi:regulator of protease activity HflC (stomatin/prohibitin superfamily)